MDLFFYFISTSFYNARLFIIKFAEPFFACIFSAILLKENIFQIQYPIAFVLISAGIVLAYKEDTSREKIQ